MAKRAAHVDAIEAAWAAGNYAQARRLAAPAWAAGGAQATRIVALAHRLPSSRYGLGLGLGAAALQLAAWGWVLYAAARAAS